MKQSCKALNLQIQGSDKKDQQGLNDVLNSLKKFF
jgi:hypothetical protein